MKKKKYLLLVLVMLVVLTGCGTAQGDLATGFDGFSWSSLTYIFSWIIVKTSLIFGNNIVYGLIVITVILRLAMVPMYKKQIKSQEETKKIQPELKKLQAKYKGKEDKESKQKMAMAQQELYKKHGINPFAGCLPMLVQMPLLFVFYGAIQNLFVYTDKGLMNAGEGVSAGAYITDETLSTVIPIFGDMAGRSIFFVILAGLLMFASSKLTMAGQDSDAPGSAMMKNMMYLSPLMIVFVGFSLPGALAIYWTIGSLFTLIQTFVYKKHDIIEQREKRKLKNKK